MPRMDLICDELGKNVNMLLLLLQADAARGTRMAPPSMGAAPSAATVRSDLDRPSFGRHAY